MLNAYWVGYEDEPIGIYYGRTEDEAIYECRSDIAGSPFGFKFDTSARDRLTKGLIAVKIEEKTNVLV